MSNRPPPIRTPSALAALLLLPLLAACPGRLEGFETGGGASGGASGAGGMTGGGSGGATTVLPCDAPAMVFMKDKAAGGCLGMGCHTDYPPDLRSNADLRNMLGAMTGLFSTGPCSGKPMIDLTNPASSLLLTRITGVTCGPQMPFALPPLTPDAIDCVTRWVMTP